MESFSLLFSSSHSAGLLSGFQHLRSDRRMCDVVLETGGVSFPCHRALLASSSEYFWALFGETTVERSALSVSLLALTPEGLGVMLDFLYTGWLSLSPSTLPVVMEAARYLQVQSAVSLCERFLIDGLTAATCCQYANLAECHALPEALAAGNHAVAMEMGVLLRENRQDLLELNIQSLTALLDAEEIPGVKEVDLMRLVLNWLDVNGPLPLVRSNLLLSRLRFGLVASSDLTELSHSHRAMATPLMRSQVTAALEYHRLQSARPIKQSRHSSLRALTNHVLLIGAGANRDWPEQQVLTFDLRDRKFSSLSAGFPRSLRHPCVCSVGGFLLVIGGEELVGGGEEGGGEEGGGEEGGGQEGRGMSPVTAATTNRVWRFDPRFDLWEEADSMTESRAHFACCMAGDVVYAVGGRHSDPGGGTHSSLSSVEYYDMAAGLWRRGASLPRPLYGHAAAMLGTGLCVSGGIPGNQPRQGGGPAGRRGDRGESSRELWFLDAGGGKVWEKRAPMSIGRFGHRMASLSGRVYALLGMYEPFSDIERYDWPEDHWTRLRPLLIGSFGYGLVATPSGTLLLFGGRKWSNGQEVGVKSVLEYEPARDRWKEVCQLPTPLSGTECALLALAD